jgi:DNA-binding NarL/FixJ family response regulator
MENTQKKIKILLVDDDEMMRIYFRDIFWIHGKSNKYEIIMVSSLEKAEDLLKNPDTRPDTIFLDVLMSSKGAGCSAPAYQMALSLGFISRIKKNKDYSNINIIIYSGQKDEILKEEALKLGVDGYLAKGEIMPKEIILFTDKMHGTNN